jgi:hypothetical protein
MKKKDRIQSIKNEFKEEPDKCKEEKKNVYSQINKVKFAVYSKKKIENVPVEFLDQDSMDIIKSFLDSYSEDYNFHKGDIFYDCEAKSLKYVKLCKKMANVSIAFP